MIARQSVPDLGFLLSGSQLVNPHVPMIRFSRFLTRPHPATSPNWCRNIVSERNEIDSSIEVTRPHDKYLAKSALRSSKTQAVARNWPSSLRPMASFFFVLG